MSDNLVFLKKFTQDIIDSFPGREISFNNNLIHFYTDFTTILQDVELLVQRFDFEYLVDCSCVQRGKGEPELYYLLLNVSNFSKLLLWDKTPENNSFVSLKKFWKGLNWCELENTEMFGVCFGEEVKLRLVSKQNRPQSILRKNQNQKLNNFLFEDRFEHLKKTGSHRHRRNELSNWYQLGPYHHLFYNSLQTQLQMEENKIKNMIFELGFTYSKIEKTAENIDFKDLLSLGEISQWIAPQNYQILVAMGVENLFQIDIPERAKAIRMVFLELSRIVEHFWALSRVLKLLELSTPFKKANIGFCLGCELINQLMSDDSKTPPVVIGGVRVDMPLSWVSECLSSLRKLKKIVDEIYSLMANSKFWIERMSVVSISAADGIDYSLSGPVLRASGINFDLRKSTPYYFYGELDFDLPLGMNGQCLDLYFVRIEEIRQSIKIINQLLDNLPTGKYNYSLETNIFKPDNCLDTGINYTSIETANGEYGVLINYTEGTKANRVRLRTPSFFNCQGLENVLQGSEIDEAILSFTNLNIYPWEIDR